MSEARENEILNPEGLRRQADENLPQAEADAAFSTETIVPGAALPAVVLPGEAVVPDAAEDLQPIAPPGADLLPFDSTEIEPPLFGSWIKPPMLVQPRVPHFGHVFLLAALVVLSLLITSVLTRSALYFHLFGISTVKQAIGDIHYTLGSMGSLYLFTLLGSILVFPLIWHRGFFDGLQWRGTMAFRLRGRLFVAAFACFLLALINGWLMPGPIDAPIDKMFRTPGAAWLMFFFGITFAPFFEEMAFRGFLLPAVCTALDWLGEKTHGQIPPPLDSNGHPQWSLLSMCLGSLLVSVPFALMHAEQTSYSIGPFSLLVLVSLVLCWVRLRLRSLAASVIVHACYNFLLFSLMLLGTSGFRHLEQM